jgi:hypothetical protein
MITLGRAFTYGLVCMGIGVLYGCGFLDMVAGVQYGPEGQILTGPGVGDVIADAAASFLPYGLGIGAAIRWGLVEYRHHRLVAAGKKDDNRDGVEDAPKV